MQISIVLESVIQNSHFIGCHNLLEGVGTDTMHLCTLFGQF